MESLSPWSFIDAYFEILQYFQSIPEIKKKLPRQEETVLMPNPKNVKILLIRVSGSFE